MRPLKVRFRIRSYIGAISLGCLCTCPLPMNGSFLWIFPNRYFCVLLNISLTHGFCDTYVFMITVRESIRNTERAIPDTTIIHILVSEFQSEGKYYFSDRANLWSLDILWDVLAFLHQGLHNVLGSKSSKKTKHWCYVLDFM